MIDSSQSQRYLLKHQWRGDAEKNLNPNKKEITRYTDKDTLPLKSPLIADIIPQKAIKRNQVEDKLILHLF